MEIISPKMDVVFRELMEDDLDMIKTRNTGIERAKYMMREMSLSESSREMVEYYRKKRMDRKAEDAYVYDQGKQEGRQERDQQIMLFKLVHNGKIDLQTASEQSGMTKEKFERKMEEAGGADCSMNERKDSRNLFIISRGSFLSTFRNLVLSGVKSFKITDT